MSLLSQQRWLNCFQYCVPIFKTLGQVMVLFVLGLIGLTYWVVVDTYAPGVGRPGILRKIGSVVVLIVFTALILMIVWSYLAAVTTDPGRVPPGWHPFLDDQQARHELERMAYSDWPFDRRDPRRPRFCKRCQAWKPERAHHCSVLGRCVLKMDHYCIWTVNCIGLMNYKYFLLFLLYTFIATLMACLLLIPPVILFFNNALKGPMAPAVFIVAVTDGAFAVSLAGFLVMHLQLIAANCTTIEMYEKERIHPWPYNKGMKRNLEEVFGRRWWRWFLPFYTKEERRQMMDAVLNTRLLPTPFLHSAVV